MPKAGDRFELVEEYQVLEGRFEVMVEGEWVTLMPGESASVPVGALHTFRNRSGSMVRVRNVHRPGARFDQYIEHIYKLLRALAGLGRVLGMRTTLPPFRGERGREGTSPKRDDARPR